MPKDVDRYKVRNINPTYYQKLAIKDKKGTVSMGKTMRMLYRIRKERREKEIERSGAYS